MTTHDLVRSALVEAVHALDATDPAYFDRHGRDLIHIALSVLDRCETIADDWEDTTTDRR